MKRVKYKFYLLTPKEEYSDVKLEISKSGRVIRSVGIKVKSSEWIDYNKKTGFLGGLSTGKGTSPSNIYDNQTLNHLFNQLQTIENEYVNNNRFDYSAKDLWTKYELESRGGEEFVQDDRIENFWIKYIQKLIHDGKPHATIKTHKSNLRRWQRTVAKPDLRFSDLSWKILNNIYRDYYNTPIRNFSDKSKGLKSLLKPWQIGSV